MYSREYEPRLLPNEEKPSALIGMAMTEKQGGSDVRAGTTVGTSMGGHAYQLTGHKWFCSAPMSDGFLVLAHTRRGNVDEGLSVPVRPAAAAAGHAQRLPHPATQGQARQPLERVRRSRVRRHDRHDPRRAGPRRAHDHRDGAAHPAGLRARHGRGDASVGRRGDVARPRPRRVRQAPRRPAGDDRGAGRPRARVRGGDAHRSAARAGVRGRRVRRGRGARAASRRPSRSTG